MTLITKPDFTYVWASGGAVVAPNDAKKQLGWVAEAPPFQYDNWLQNRQDQMLAHINQRGMPAWDALTNYEAGGLSYVQGSDGKIYKSVAASGPSATVQNPTTDGTDTYWTVAFADVGAFLTQTLGDARYTQRANNLSDVSNSLTSFNNIKQNATDTYVGAVELATNAETTTGTDATRAVTPAGLSARLATVPFSKEYISSAQTITIGGLIQLTHGLGATPKFMRNYATCTAADGNYAVGDRVVFNPVDHQGTANGNGTMLILDAGDTTTIRVRFGNQSFAGAFLNKTTGAAFTPDPTKWTVSVGAWV